LISGEGRKSAVVARLLRQARFVRARPRFL
jgi:hypothetical protein